MRAPALESKLRLAAWLLAGGLSLATISAEAAPPELAGEEAGEDADEDAPQRKDAAREQVRAASAAFAAGDYQTALDHYQAAMELLPAPKLHYNMGVCHQRLSLAAETPEQRTLQRDLAIESYNAYLEQNPRADDRLEVAQTIRELGGTPITMPGLKPFEPDATIDDSADDSAEVETLTPPEPQPQPQPEPPQHKPYYPHYGRFGLALVGGYSPTMTKAVAVDAPSLFAIELHGGGFVGKRRRFALEAHSTLFTGATLVADGLAFYGYSLGLLGEQTWVLGHEAVQIGAGAVLALTGQGINTRPNAAAPVCSLDDRGAQVATRTGGLLGPRFDLGILMGPLRRASIGLLVQPSFAVFGDGPTAVACQADETPWTVLGVRRRWQFQLWIGAGFGFRF